MIDTLRISRRLRDAGATEQVAEAFASTMAEQFSIGREDLATRSDLEGVAKQARADLDVAVAAIRGEISSSEKVIRSEIEGRVLASENRIIQAQNRLVVWIAGIAFSAAGLAVALSKALQS